MTLAASMSCCCIYPTILGLVIAALTSLATVVAHAPKQRQRVETTTEFVHVVVSIFFVFNLSSDIHHSSVFRWRRLTIDLAVTTTTLVRNVLKLRLFFRVHVVVLFPPFLDFHPFQCRQLFDTAMLSSTTFVPCM